MSHALPPHIRFPSGPVLRKVRYSLLCQTFVTRLTILDTYKNCNWEKCVQSCPDDKVLITQRSSITLNGTYIDSECPSGSMNMMCCDPPGGADDAPVDPAKLFKYPDEDDVSYYYNVEKSNNNEGTSSTHT